MTGIGSVTMIAVECVPNVFFDSRSCAVKSTANWDGTVADFWGVSLFIVVERRR